MMIKSEKLKTNRLNVSSSLIKVLVVLIIGITLSIIIVSVICMLLGKPVGDDFGAISYYKQNVWLENTLESLRTTGRYGQTVSGAIFYGLFGRNVAILLPLMTLFWFMYLIFIYSKSVILPFFKINEKKLIISIFITVSMTSMVMFLNSNTNTDVGYYPTWLSYQYFFWPSGIVTYLIPFLVFASIYYMLFIRHNNLSSKLKLIFLFLITFLIGIFNETTPTTLMAIAGGITVLSFIKPFRKYIIKYRSKCVTIAFSSLLAVIALLLSPGSQERQAATGAHSRSIFQIILGVGRNIYVSFTQLMFRPTDIILLFSICLITAVIIIYLTRKNKKELVDLSKRGIIFGIVSFIVFVGSLGCSYLLVSVGYGEHAGIITRTLLLPQIIYVLSLAILFTSASILMICKFKDKLLNIILLCLILSVCLCMPAYIQRTKNQIDSSIKYFSSWNEQEKIIKKSLESNKSSTIYLPNSASGIGVGQNLSCKNGWLYLLIQEYYGAKKICALSDIGLEPKLY